MGFASAKKLQYRSRFLRSETWRTVRLEALARDDAKCRICGLRSLSNDEHHIAYPEKWSDTKSKHLRTLCRPCHTLFHELHIANGKDIPATQKAFRKTMEAFEKWFKQQMCMASQEPVDVPERRPCLAPIYRKDLSACQVCGKEDKWIAVVDILGSNHPNRNHFIWPMCCKCLAIFKTMFPRTENMGMKEVRNGIKEVKKRAVENSPLTESFVRAIFD